MSCEKPDSGDGKRVLPLPDDSAVAHAELRRRVRQDRALVDRCVSGDADAWAELYHRYNGVLGAVIKNLLAPRHWDPNTVEEIVARVWCLLLADGGQLLDRFDPERECRLSTYLGTIAKSEAGHLLRSERRRRRRERIASRPESDDGGATLGLTPSEFREFVAELTPRERQFLAGHLLRPANGVRVSLFSDAYRWQLRSRICRKLREFVFRDS